MDPPAKKINSTALFQTNGNSYDAVLYLNISPKSFSLYCMFQSVFDTLNNQITFVECVLFDLPVVQHLNVNIYPAAILNRQFYFQQLPSSAAPTWNCS